MKTKSIWKRTLSAFLIAAMLVTMLPGMAFANESTQPYDGMEVKMPYGSGQPDTVTGFVWEKGASSDCSDLVAHAHTEGCYTLKCDHKDGHLPKCYSTSTAYSKCTHNDESEHTGSVDVKDVVTLEKTDKFPYFKATVKEHEAKEVVQKEMDYLYANGYPGCKGHKLGFIPLGCNGVTAVYYHIYNEKFCYTTTNGSEPDLCNHTHTAIGGECYEAKSKLLGGNCDYGYEHKHSLDCQYQKYTLRADVNGNGTPDDNDPRYIVKFVNGETVLQESEHLVSTVPVYKGVEPTKAADAQYTYTFEGWKLQGTENTGLSEVEGEAVYEAQFSATTNKYTITWKNGDEVVETDEVEYGKMPEYNGEEPTKAADAQYTYTFAGWKLQGAENTGLSEVKGEAVYEAQFTATTNTYTVIWKNGEAALETDENVPYGEMPVYNGNTPTKTGEGVVYTFAGWKLQNADKTGVVTVTGNAVYEATFSEKQVFTVKYVIDNKLVKEMYLIDGETVVAYNPGVREYYVLNGWYTNSECTGEKFNFDEPIKAETKLYAKWVPVNDVNGDGTADEEQKVTMTVGTSEDKAINLDEFNGEALINHLKANAEVATTHGGSVTAVTQIGTLPTAKGETAQVEFKVAVSKGEGYSEYEQSVLVWVILPSYPAAFNITVNGNGSAVLDGKTSGTLTAGEYDFIATPGAVSYVSAVTVNGTVVDIDKLDNYIENRAFTMKQNVINDTEYNIVVTFEERVLKLNGDGQTTFEIPVNKNVKPYDQMTDLQDTILNAIVDSIEPDGDYTIEFYTDGLFGLGKGWYGFGYEGNGGIFDGLGEAAYKAAFNLIFSYDEGVTIPVRITYHSFGKYPTVQTEDLTIKLVDGREDAGLGDAVLSDYQCVNTNTVYNYVMDNYDFGNLTEDEVAEYVTVELDKNTPLPTEVGQTAEVKFNVTLAGNDTYQDATAVITVNVTKLSAQCYAVLGNTEALNGTVYVNGVELIAGTKIALEGNNLNTVVATPNTTGEVHYAVNFIEVQDSYGAIDEEHTYNNDGKASAELKFKAESTNEEGGVTYTVYVDFMEVGIVWEDGGIPFCPGLDEADPETLYNAAVEDPKYDASNENAKYTFEYLAREEGKVTIVIPDISTGLGFTIPGGPQEIELNDLWMTPGEEIVEVDLYAEMDKIEAMVGGIGTTTNFAEVADYVEKFLKDLPNMHLGAHEFGMSEDGAEWIRVTYEDEKYIIGQSENFVEIVDSRTPTTITANNAEVTYGFTEAQLRDALQLTVTGEDGAEVTAPEVEFITNIKGLDASSNAYEIKVSFAGNETYAPCEAVVSVIVNKAPCSIDYDSQVVTWGEDYSFELVKNPADVDTINFMIGLDLADINRNEVMPSGYIHIQMPGVLGKLIKGEFTIDEFSEKLESVATLGEDALAMIGIDSDVLNTILNTIHSVAGESEEWGDVKVKVNGDSLHPENIGVYLAGAVTADSNYETAFTADYLIVMPKATEAELEFNFTDDNGIIMNNLIEDGIYNLGAAAFVDGEKNDAATNQVEHLFLRANVDGTVEFVYMPSNDALDITELSKTGAYAQLAFILDWGNELYYAVPAARAYVVVPELVDVEFVDAEGNSTDLYDYVYTEKPITAPSVTITDNQGEAVAQDHLTITYYGYTLNHPDKLYQSTTPPTDAGVYTAVAVYADLAGEVFGADAAVIRIDAIEASIEVENQVVFAGTSYDLGVTTSPADCKYVTVVAGIDASGEITSENLNPFSGAVNVDFPARLDAVLKTLMPSAYEDGISANEVLSNLDKVSSKLGSLGMDPEAVNVIVDTLAQIPQYELGSVKVTFHDNVVPENIGLYMVGASVCDPNYKMAYDFGYLIVQPETTEVELAFNYVDENNIFTANYIESGMLDLGSHVVVGGDVTAEMAAEAEKSLHNLCIGLNTEGQFEISAEPMSAHGAYTQLAFLADSGNKIYYAEPIIRSYVVVPETVDVTIADENVTYNGERHDADVTVTHNNGTVIEDSEHLYIRYVGYDAKGIEIYNSTEAPVNAGIYTVMAVYADAEADLYGMGTGTLTVVPAEAEIDVKDAIVAYEDDYFFEINTTPADLEYMTIMGGVDGEGNLLVEGMEGVNHVINIDFPAVIDTYMQQVFPQAYENGIELLNLERDLNAARNIFEKLGLDTAKLDEAMTVIEGMATVDTIVTFKEFSDIKPVHMGVYAVTAISVDANYMPAADVGFIAIVPDVVPAEIEFNSLFPDDGVIKTLPVGYDFDFGVTAKTIETGEVIDPSLIKNAYMGVTAYGSPYLSTAEPTELGTYTQVAMLANLADVTYAAVPVSRTFTIVLNDVEIEFEGTPNMMYNGQPRTLTPKLVDGNGTEVEGELTVRYIGSRNGVEFYWSEEAPKDYGVYQIVATYAGSEIYAPDVAAATFTIDKRPLTISIDSKSKLVGDEDPELTYTVINGLVEGESIEIELGRVPGEEAGSYKINHTIIDALVNANYNINSYDGWLTIEKREIVITADDETITAGDAPALTYTVTGDPLLADDTLEAILGEVSVSSSYDGETAGTYVLTVSAGLNEGYESIYELTLDYGTLTVNDKDHEHAHNELKYDEYNHWYECECGDKTGTEAHVDEELVDELCDVCGAAMPEDEEPPVEPEKTDIATLEATLEYTEVEADGTAKEPTVTIDGLTEGEDFTVEYANNTEAGTATVTITGIGDYTGTKTLTFTITEPGEEPPVEPEKTDIATLEAALEYTEVEADGTAKEPAVTIEGLTKDVDYTVAYTNNVEAGTATVTITGIGDYTGTKTLTFTITAAGGGETPTPPTPPVDPTPTPTPTPGPGTGGGIGGGFYVPTVQNPTIEAGEGVEVTLNADGTIADIKVQEGYELDLVELNGKDLGDVLTVKNLKTGDVLKVTANKLPTEEEILIGELAKVKLVARSRMSKLDGKPSIRVHWFDKYGSELEFDGYEVFRSVKRFKGYGKKPFFETTKKHYHNTLIEEGTKYFYKVRGYVELNGQKYYTDWSLKAWRYAEF